MLSFRSTFCLAAIVLTGLTAGSGNGNAAEVAIGETIFSVPDEYVSGRGWQRGAKYLNSVTVAFSIPSYEPVAGGAEKRKQALARGEEIINLSIRADLGGGLSSPSEYEAWCHRDKMGFRVIERDGVAGQECLHASGGFRRNFPIAIPSGRAALFCLKSGLYESCSVFVEGRDNKISLSLSQVNAEPIIRIPALIDAADQFIAQKMTRVRAGQ